jgi:hypothetical protein
MPVSPLLLLLVAVPAPLPMSHGMPWVWQASPVRLVRSKERRLLTVCRFCWLTCLEAATSRKLCSSDSVYLRSTATRQIIRASIPPPQMIQDLPRRPQDLSLNVPNV